MTVDVVITGGGTGGHVFPGIAVANQLKQHGLKVAWLGSNQGLETDIVPKHDIPFYSVPVAALRGKGLRRWLLLPGHLLKTTLQARKLLRQLQPKVVLGMGGFVSGPGAIAASLSGIPLILHEQNAVAGLTNKVLAHLAKQVFQAFPNTINGASTIGNPVRAVIGQIAHYEQSAFGADRPMRLLIMGGSRGAKILNDTLPDVANDLMPALSLDIYHMTGKAFVDSTRARYQSYGVDATCVDFIDDMAARLAWADCVICRSGALTVSELAAAGRASILIPYPYAVDDHQTENARYLSDQDAAILLPQSELTVAKLSHELMNVYHHPEQLLRLAHHAKQAARPDAAVKITQFISTLM